MKNVTAIIFAPMLVASVTTGCFGRDDNSSSSSMSSSSSSMSSSSELTASERLAAAHKAVREAYGEDYIPSQAIEKEALSEVYGVNPDDVEEFIGEGPMMSAHVDQFIAIKAKDGKGADVEKQLNAYRDKLLEDTTQYPSNMAKIQSSAVTRYDDYVFFTMLGKADDVSEDEESALEFAKNEAKKAVDAIANLFR